MRLVLGAVVAGVLLGAPAQGRQARGASDQRTRSARADGGGAISSATSNDTHSQSSGSMEHNGANLTFLALGDSYTIGEKVDSAGRWPVQLARALRTAGIAVDDPRIVARTGWTTDELNAGIDNADVKGTFSLVSLLIGVNNQYRGRSLDEYRAQFRGLLDRAIGYAGGDAARVIVLSIPDWGVMPFAEGRDRAKIGREIDQFNAVARAGVEHTGAQWVDITPVSREKHDGWAASDGLHPSAAQYSAWAALAFAPAKLVLTAP